MSFLDRVLAPPSYGYERAGALTVPTHRELFREFFGRVNVFRSRKNWLPFVGWLMTLSLAVPLIYFLFHFSFPLFVIGFIYSMVLMGTHGTVWLHRYSTHRAYAFRNPFTRFVCRNLVIKIVPEEIYVVSHHVHHAFSEKPGDPYNVHGGWLYCFLADANHQMIRQDLTEAEYARVARLIEHTGVRLNSYGQYLKWGSICHPAYTMAHYLLNWTFWFGVFYLIGGSALAVALFGMAGVWAVGVRTYNYEGHGGGKDKREEGIDFNREDLSINQIWPGYVAGEWHNNHHLYPNGARSGFLPYQLDLAWLFIRGYAAIGGISHYRDFKAEFLKLHRDPYLARVAAEQDELRLALLKLEAVRLRG
jgi:stearoyl-CoA desaturase (delta-9 desaturase)